MPTVESTLTIDAPAGEAYVAARDRIEELAGHLDNVESIEVLERAGPRTVSRWVGSVDTPFGQSVKFKWTEADIWDDAALTCTFEQTEGDFDVYKGTWSFADSDGDCACTLQIEFAKDIPGIGPLIQGLLQKKVQEMADNTLAGLKRMVEGG